MFVTETSLRKLLLIYVLWIGLSAFSASLVYLYFRDAGVSEQDLVASFFFSVTASILLIAALSGKNKIDFRKLMGAGVFLLALSYAALALLTPSKELLFVYSAVIGLNFFFFWAPFNIMYFEFSREKAAMFGTFYFSIMSLLMMFMPLLSGFIAENSGFPALFLSAAFAYLLLIPVLLMLGKREYCYTLMDVVRDTKGLRTLIFVEGIYGGGMMAALAVIPLFYFHKPMEMGLYLSITAIFSVIASFMVSGLSDKSRKRVFYIRIFGTSLGLASLASSLATTAGTWYTAVSVRNFFSTLFMPFTTAIITDTKKDIADVMVGRELLLNAGRVIGLASVFICTLFYDIYLSLAFLGLVILLYPVVVELKRKHISLN